MINRQIKTSRINEMVAKDYKLGEDFAENPNRIAYLVSRYPAVSHTFILREVQQLRARGFEIEVASINNPDRNQSDMTLDERKESDNTYYVKKHGFKGALAAHIWALRQPLNYAKGLWKAIKLGGWNIKKMLYGALYFTEAVMLARWMSFHNIKHLHVHFATAAASVALVLKQFYPISLSITVHGPDEFYDVPGQWLAAKIAAADFIICIGEFARSQLMYLSPASEWHKFEVCQLGVDVTHYQAKKNGPQNEIFTILCVGRLTPAKGQRVLIDACSNLRNSGRNVRLVIIGTGPDEYELKNKVLHLQMNEMVEFTGALNQDQVQSWYAKADMFALASFAEGIPVVLMEAMASGIPCVSTRITGIPELIRDGIDGLLVTPSSADELVSAITYLMDDNDLQQDLASSGRKQVEDNYDLNQNIERLSNLFQRRLERL